jgi:hypothetical protein
MRLIVAATRVAAPLAVSALCTIPAPAAAQGFEGTVTWQMEKGQMAQTYKGTQVRTEMSGGGREGVMIMDNSAKTMTMLMPSDKMYMVMNLRDSDQGGDHSDRKPPKITPTGKTETIAGRTCEVYLYAENPDKPANKEMCVAKGMGYFMGGSAGPMGGMGMARQGQGADISAIAANPEYRRLYQDGFFPLRISRIKGDSVTTQMIATKIEPKSVDASLFQVPSGFQEMKMPAGMGMPQRP